MTQKYQRYNNFLDVMDKYEVILVWYSVIYLFVGGFQFDSIQFDFGSWKRTWDEKTTHKKSTGGF